MQGLKVLEQHTDVDVNRLIDQRHCEVPRGVNINNPINTYIKSDSKSVTKVGKYFGRLDRQKCLVAGLN